jgi:hypothetical protein
MTARLKVGALIALLHHVRLPLGNMKLTPAELFHRAGAALFGDQYVTPLAVALGVERSTAGKSRVPADVWLTVRRLLTAT